MKRLGWFVVALAMASLLLWLAGRAFFAAPPRRDTEALWPKNLGRLSDLPKRFPSHEASTNANEVARIAADVIKLRLLRQAIFNYLAAQVAKPDDAVDAPPAAIADFLRDHKPAIDELRAQLLANAPPRWAVDTRELFEPPGPNPSMHIDLFALFTLDALDRRRRGEDELAWQDLEAEWKLTRGLWSLPDLGALQALNGSRLINDVAWKMRAPAPAWWRDFVAFDVEREVVSLIQYDAWRSVEIARRYPAGEHDDDSTAEKLLRNAAEVVVGAWRLRRANEYATRARNIAADFSSVHDCGTERISRFARDYATLLRRVRRFNAEREGVSKVLALKNGMTVNIDRSTCTDRTWHYGRGADGSWSLSISPAIAPEREQRVVLPLVWHYGPHA